MDAKYHQTSVLASYKYKKPEIKAKKEREKRYRFMSCKRWVAKSEVFRIYIHGHVSCADPTT